MKLLLVGGAGHVGQLITPYLRAQHTLRVLDLSPPADGEIEHVKGSVLDPEAIRLALRDVDGFIWLAMRNGQGGMVTNQDAETIINNYDLNTKALHLFLFLAQEAGVTRGVYTSSMSVHYRGRPSYPGEDEVPRDSPSVYGLTKGLGEEICAYFARWFDMNIIGLRISGPAMAASSSRSMKRTWPTPISAPSPQSPRRRVAGSSRCSWSATKLAGNTTCPRPPG